MFGPNADTPEKREALLDALNGPIINTDLETDDNSIGGTDENYDEKTIELMNEFKGHITTYKYLLETGASPGMVGEPDPLMAQQIMVHFKELQLSRNPKFACLFAGDNPKMTMKPFN